MKKTGTCLLLVGLALAACQNNNTDARYLDLNTGEYVAMKKDSTSGYLVNAQTGKPVDVYVDTQTHDTIWGRTGKVVNGNIVKTRDHWTLRDESDHAAIGVDASSPEKVKVDGDGEVKIKDGSYTKKVEKDGDVKIETGTKTIKVDAETGERKVKKDHNIGDKIKKIF